MFRHKSSKLTILAASCKLPPVKSALNWPNETSKRVVEKNFNERPISKNRILEKSQDFSRQSWEQNISITVGKVVAADSRIISP